MKTIKILVLLFLNVQLLVSQNAAFSHKKWNSFLHKYVTTSGEVDYKGIKANVRDLDSYLADLKGTSPKPNWSANEAKAYWINAYNAFTVKLIVDNYPLKSIKDIAAPWDKRFIKIEEKTYSLNDIENKILRPTYKDGRIHFAIVCAAKSCPILSNHAYTPSTLDKQLDEAAARFLNDNSRNKITASAIQISEIFNWFRADFTKKESIVAYLNRYSNVKINSKAKISFLTYNWSLNEKK